MMGPSLTENASCGIIPRVVRTIFQTVMEADEHMEFTVQFSMLEIYMERVRPGLPRRPSAPHAGAARPARGRSRTCSTPARPISRYGLPPCSVALLRRPGADPRGPDPGAGG